MAQRFVVEAVLGMARELPGYPELRILDLSTGRGELLSVLQREGASVRGTHYLTDDYKLVGCDDTLPFPIDNAVDLRHPLTYEADSFDLVLLIEVLEHLEVHRPVLNEVGRVLAPGGHLIVSTPNISRLHSRLHFLLTGTHKLIRRRVGWDLQPDELYAYHINPVDLPLLHTLLFHVDLRIRRIRMTRFKLRHAWLMLLYPVFWLAARRETRHRVAAGLHEEGEDDLFRWLMHPAVLTSEQLLLLAQKTETSASRRR